MAKLITVTKAKMKSSAQKHSKLVAKDTQFKAEKAENDRRQKAEKKRRDLEHKAGK